MLVKCRICGKKVDRNEAFKVAVEGKPNAYYCSEAEYNKMMENRKNRNDTYYCIYDIFGYTVTNTVLNKEVNALGKIYGFKLILEYLHDNQEYLTRIVGREYNSEFAKIKYFSAILKNSLVDYRDSDEEIPHRTQATVKHHVVSKQINENIGAEKTKYKKKKKSRRCIDDILTEVGEKE